MPSSPASSADSPQPTPRREFIGTLAASALVLAGTACAVPAAATQTAPSPAPASNGSQHPSASMPPAPTHWDDSWFGRLTAKHKAVFDSPEIDDGLAVSQAAGYIRGMHDALGATPTDVQAVVVMRHRAVPMVFNDAMWAKYPIGEMRSQKDDSGKWVTTNPYAGKSSGDPQATASRPQSNLTWLAAHGHVLLGCDLATRAFSSQLASKVHGDSKAIYEELKANLLPGVILQPTGVYAVHRAQEAGCSYIRST